MGVEDEHLLCIVIFSGTLVHFYALVKLVAKKWSDTGVMIAIYREIVEIAEHEVSEAS